MQKEKPKQVREIIVYPYMIDEKGTIHLRAMVKSKSKGYKAKMKRLVAMGIFSKDTLHIVVKEGGNAKEKTDI